MVLKLYGPTFIAGGTAVVAMALAEKQIPFELVFVDMFVGEHKGAAHCAKQPFGQVPVIDDEGFILFESRAICRYLEEKYPTQGTRLVPTELKAKAWFEQAASIEFSNFEPYARGAYLQAIVQPMLDQPIDQAVLAKALADLSERLDVYEAILGKFLAGDEFTLADLFHMAFAGPLVAGGYDLMTTKGPNVARWWKDITRRPSWVSLQNGVKSTATAT
ncbi:glutathione S-transferase [Mycena epipterygia]|nr:glutathione S-transferase [Mycena epipterygia]